MGVHPDKTAFRAVDACGGTYTSSEVDSGYAQGHKDALDAALEAVAKPDALMEELLDALKRLYSKTVVGTDAERHVALNNAWATIAKAEAA